MSTQQAPSTAPQRPCRRQIPVVEAARALVRPIVTVLFAGVIAAVVIDQIDAPAWFLGVALPCITWWFGERALLRRSERKEGG